MRFIFWLVCGAVLTGLTLVLPAWLAELTAQGIARGIAILGVVILWRCGLASFGHALYYGVAAYAVVLLDLRFGISDLAVRLLTGAVAAGIVGFLVGFIVRNYRGIAFAMLNLAISMMFYGLIIRSSALGSTDGFSLSQATLLGDPLSKGALIVILAIASCVVMAAVTAYLSSSAGHFDKAIKDKELRLEFLGLSARNAVHARYTASAVLCGIGGVFAASLLGQVDPDSMVNWYISGEFMLITVLAGTTSAIAPIVAAIGFEVIRSFMLDIAPYAWQLLFGLCLIVAVLFRPNGLWPLTKRRSAQGVGS